MDALGETYEPGETIVRQGDTGDTMYVIQEGQVEVCRERDGEEIRIAVLQAGDFFGEMAIFERQVRAATVRAIGPTRILTVDERTFLRQVQSDPSLAFKIGQVLASRVRRLDEDLAAARVALVRQEVPNDR